MRSSERLECVRLGAASHHVRRARRALRIHRTRGMTVQEGGTEGHDAQYAARNQKREEQRRQNARENTLLEAGLRSEVWNFSGAWSLQPAREICTMLAVHVRGMASRCLGCEEVFSLSMPLWLEQWRRRRGGYAGTRAMPHRRSGDGCTGSSSCEKKSRRVVELSSRSRTAAGRFARIGRFAAAQMLNHGGPVGFMGRLGQR